MQSDQRSPLGLGPLETAIMQVMWEADHWLMVRDIRDRMNYPAVAYTIDLSAGDGVGQA
jgi:predicted transcriptional regulator